MGSTLLTLSIGQQIKQLRLDRGLTQQELALQSGLSFSFINQLERGKQTVRMDAVNKLAELFGYEINLVRKNAAEHE
jgi:y4mF family transcriptional regulator